MYQINEDITLVSYYPNEKVAIEWYQDLALCKQLESLRNKAKSCESNFRLAAFSCILFDSNGFFG